MTFRVIQCEMAGDDVVSRTPLAGAVQTTEQAEAVAASAARAFPHYGFDKNRGFWWAEDQHGKRFRLYIEVSSFDETDGV